MSDGVIFAILFFAAFLVIVLLTRKSWNKGIENANEATMEFTPTKFTLQFKREASALEHDAAEVEETAKMISPEPAGPSAGKQALPDKGSERPSKDHGAMVTVGDLVVVGADWGGLIAKAKQFLDDHDIPAPENESSLGELLGIINEDWPDILPDRTVGLASRADQLLEKLMAAQPSDIEHGDIRRFSSALTSLHQIISKAASKARHPAHRRKI